MLYERWREIARDNGDRLALLDLAGGRRWTFRQLAGEAETRPVEASGVVFATGAGASFVLDVLRAWRSGGILCPLEPGRQAPSITSEVPKGIVHLKTTSATMGTERLVAFTASQLAADADHIVAAMGLRPDWPNLGAISLAHSYGFSNLILPLLLHGIPLILVGSALPEAIRRAAASEPQVTLPAVPALWKTWHEADALPSNIRLAISAGAPLPAALEQAVFREHDLKIHNFYGSTECGGIAYDASSVPREEAAFVGAPMPGVNCVVGAGDCLEVRGPAVAEYYWPEPSRALRNGVFFTSDLARIANGRVLLLGREGDQINVAGRKLAPETIEMALAAHPEVLGSLVFGVPDSTSGRGETVVACAAVRHPIASDTLKKFLMARLPAWQVPREWWLMDSLETNDRGKLPRAVWRERYLAKQRLG
jgi:acyl-CoA synthetase (AMP-forming)/AMP-acid ligase II